MWRPAGARLYLFIILSPQPVPTELARIMPRNELQWKRCKAEEREGKQKIFPFMPFKLKARPQTDFHPSKASYWCGNPKMWHLVKVRCSSPGLRPMLSPSQTLAIHSYPGPFSLIAWHPTLFSLNTPSRYQSISSVAYPMNDYQHTLLNRLSWRSYPSPSSPHGRTNLFI